MARLLRFAVLSTLVVAGCGGGTSTASKNSVVQKQSTTSKPTPDAAARTTLPAAKPTPPKAASACTFSGTIGSTDVGGPIDKLSGGFLTTIDYGGGPLDVSFGDGIKGGAGRPYLQLSGDAGIWNGDASVTPGVSASAHGAMKSDLGDDPLDVSLDVTCSG